jgi:hypothetical protein
MLRTFVSPCFPKLKLRNITFKDRSLLPVVQSVVTPGVSLGKLKAIQEIVRNLSVEADWLNIKSIYIRMNYCVQILVIG